MKDEALWIRSEWDTADLDGGRVQFRVYLDGGRALIDGYGVFRASTRKDGAQRIEISVQGREPDHVTQVRLPVDEERARKIRRSPAGSGFDFTLDESAA